MKKRISILLAVMLTGALAACGNGRPNYGNASVAVKNTGLSGAATEASTPLTSAQQRAEAQAEAMPAVTVQVGDKSFAAVLCDNAAARTFLLRLPMSLDMSELNGNEKYCYLPEGLPTSSERVGRIRAGDLMLYGSDCLVLFYESFSTSYSYTSLGYISDPTGLAEALAGGNASVTFAADM